ncbi:MAG TPA: response regulator, partial [Bacteroidales bacterium]|nr:response regulator [Bacteroidales bacterium]
ENVAEELLPPVPHTGKVLIVDDLYENILLLSEFLRDTGIEVLSAENGAEAHKQLQKNPDVKLVLMDIKLSGEDGISIAKELMLRYPELVVVAQTAYSSEQIKEECLNAGFSSYIVKPIDKQGFLDIVVPYLQA